MQHEEKPEEGMNVSLIRMSDFVSWSQYLGRADVNDFKQESSDSPNHKKKLTQQNGKNFEEIFTITICSHESDAEGILGWGFFKRFNRNRKSKRPTTTTTQKERKREEKCQSEKEKEKENDFIFPASLIKKNHLAVNTRLVAYLPYCQRVWHHLNVDLRLTRW